MGQLDIPGLARVEQSDLAVLRVQGKDLPAMLGVETSQAVRETMPVFVSGFPGGKLAGLNMCATSIEYRLNPSVVKTGLDPCT